MTARYRLHIIPPQGEPFDHVLRTDSVVIGRSTEADLVIADRFLSRFHSRIYSDHDGLWLEDLGSRNGTLLNGRPIHGSQRLRASDSIKVSGSHLTLRHLDDSDPLPVRSEERPAPPISYPLPVAMDPVPTDAPDGDLGRGTLLFNASQILADQGSVVRSGSGTAAGTGTDDLRRYAERLQLLNEVHRALGNSMELPELLELILDRIFDHLRPELGALYLDKGGELELVGQRSRSNSKRNILYSRSLVREVAQKGMAALVNDLETDARFASAQSIIGAGVRSLVAAPLLAPKRGSDGKESIGMIVLQSHIAVRRFSEEDLELLVSLAGVAALSLRNVALAEEAVERRRLEKELALGRRIQEALLPDRLPDLPGYDLYAVNIPWHGVSGDYYQVVERPERQDCMLMIADVSGKGVGASLITASLEALSAVPVEDGQPPDKICRRLSRQLFQRTPPEKFATAFFAALHPADGKVLYTNAGHNQGLIRRADGSIEKLSTTGPPLGLIPEAEFHADETELRPGDVLMLYTDGFTEVVNREEDEFGLERLCEVLSRDGAMPLGELVTAINHENERFADGVPYADDRTVVLVRRHGES